MVKWVFNTKDQSKAEFFRLLNLRRIFLNFARKGGGDRVPRTRDQRVAVFNLGTDWVRVLEKTSGSGSGTDRVRVLALHFYQSGIIGY